MLSCSRVDPKPDRLVTETKKPAVASAADRSDVSEDEFVSPKYEESGSDSDSESESGSESDSESEAESNMPSASPSGSISVKSESESEGDDSDSDSDNASASSKSDASPSRKKELEKKKKDIKSASIQVKPNKLGAIKICSSPMKIATCFSFTYFLCGC